MAIASCGYLLDITPLFSSGLVVETEALYKLARVCLLFA
jgi:hypothetical protein